MVKWIEVMKIDKTTQLENYQEFYEPDLESEAERGRYGHSARERWIEMNEYQTSIKVAFQRAHVNWTLWLLHLQIQANKRV